MDRLRTAALLACAAALLLAPQSARAQQLEPRAYTNTPVGLDFLIAGYGQLHGAVLSDPGETLQDAALDARSAALSYVRSLELAGRSAKAGGLLQYGCVAGRAQLGGETFERRLCGLTDPRLFLSVNFYGAPALGAREFAHYRQNWIVGMRLQLQAPLGRYDADRLLNLGRNRWLFQPQLGISKAWQHWTLELSAGVDLYSDNREFFGAHQREQDPLYAAQLHAIYSFGSGVWAALSGTYYTGGAARIDGRASSRPQGGARLGATLTIPLGGRHSLKLAASSGIAARTGGEFDAVGIAWQMRFGAL